MSAAEGGNWFSRLRQGLSRSSSALADKITGALVKKRLDAQALEELEDALVTSDLGVETARAMVAKISKDRFGKEVTDTEVKEALARAIAEELAPFADPLASRGEHRPQVVLVCGVNGVGKTTTIGKLAKQASESGLSVMLAACDTFRAAAVEQLKIWGERNGVPVITGKERADPAALAFSALETARAQAKDLLLIDTAGRLQNRRELMDELQKIIRVIRKLDPQAPHDCVLILDATTGQNAHNQVDVFREMVDVTGLIITKLDGTARGGVVVALARRHGLPIHGVGVGESIDDLKAFEPEDFARALLGLDARAP